MGEEEKENRRRRRRRLLCSLSILVEVVSVAGCGEFVSGTNNANADFLYYETRRGFLAAAALRFQYSRYLY